MIKKNITCEIVIVEEMTAKGIIDKQKPKTLNNNSKRSLLASYSDGSIRYRKPGAFSGKLSTNF